MKKFLTITLIILFLAPSAIRSEPRGPWKPVLNKNGISVHSRPLPGSDVDELRAQAVIEARIEVLGEVLRDVDSHALWMPDYRVAKILKKTADEETMFIYVSMKMPFPVRDRDFVIRARSVRDYPNGIVTVYINAVQSPAVAEAPGHVRITGLSGKWVFRYIDREHTHVTYQFSVNPGGSIPLSLSNYTSRTTPYRTIMGMIKMSGIKKYRGRAAKSTDRALVEKYLVKP